MATTLTETLADLAETREYLRNRATNTQRDYAFGDGARLQQTLLVEAFTRRADAVDAAIRLLETKE